MKSIYINAETLPEAWEKAVVACWEQGESFPTQYDKRGDENSKDVMATIHVRSPFMESRIHRSFPGGLNDLEKYRAEVMYGVHDYWMDDKENPQRWDYTYHERLFNFAGPTDSFEHGPGYDGPSYINQIYKSIELLKGCSHTRRAQAITWQPWNDLNVPDCPCLQRMWFRVQESDCEVCEGNGRIYMACDACEGKGRIKKLNMVVHMRSNDAYKAAYMNMYAFTELQAWIASQVGVIPGEYIHVADSFHIYGSYFNEFSGFINKVKSSQFEDRVWNTSFCNDFFIEGCDELLAETKMPEDCKEKVRQRRKELTGE